MPFRSQMAADAPSVTVVAITPRQRCLAVAAVILTVGGQLVLARTDAAREGLDQVTAVSLLVGGAMVFGAATRRWVEPAPRLEFPRAGAGASGSVPLIGSRRVLPAIALAAAAMTVFAFRGEGPAVLLAWLASTAVLVMPRIRHASLRHAGISRAEGPYLAALAALIAVAAITRTWRLSLLPYNLDGDFASVGLAARALAAGQARIFSFGWAETPMLGYLPAAITTKLFGSGLVGLNASGVIDGLLIIAGVYLLGRDLFNPRVGILAAALLTVSYAHLAASRQASYIDPVVFLVYSIYFLLIGLREDRGPALAASGALAAFGCEMYFSGRIVLPVFALVVLHMALFDRAWLRSRWRSIALWSLAAVVALGPMLLVFVRDTDSLMRRTRQVFVLNPEIVRHEQGVYQTTSIPGVLLQQVRHAVLMFHYYPDTGTQFWLHVPLLDPFTGVLFALGVGYAMFHWRKTAFGLLLGWTALVVVSSALTANPPFWPRLMVVLPPAVLLAALALDRLCEFVKPPAGQHFSLVPAAALVLLLAWAGVQNWRMYVLAKGTWATPRTRIARYLAEGPATTPVYIVSNEVRWNDREFEFLVPGRIAGDLSPGDVESHRMPSGHAAMLILTREQAPLLQRLADRYRDGSVEAHSGNDASDVAFYVFRLP